MTSAERPWSATIRVDDVPETGRHIELEADQATRAAVAAPAGVDAIDQLMATFDLTRRGRDGLHVHGQVTATVRQICVVSLEPVPSEIDEAVDVDFVPPHQMAPADNGDEETHLVRAADDPEPLVDGTIDLGLLAIEFLLLGIDPYPRKAGVSFVAPAPAADPAAKAFAGLAGWKKNDTVKK
jgi:uncharacterized protein DUF177 involved in 23S rRNA accumulation